MTSDDGSRLWIGEPDASISVGGEPEKIQAASLDLAALGANEIKLATVEGVVSFAHSSAGDGLQMQIISGTNEIDVVGESAATKSAANPESSSRARNRPSRGCSERPTTAHGIAACRRKRFGSSGCANSRGGTAATSIAELQRKAAPRTPTTLSVNLEGTVLAANADGSTVIFQDETATTLLELPPNKSSESAGQRIRITGPVQVNGGSVSARASALIDNDGVHSPLEKSAAIYLRRGKHPIQVAWFNAFGETVLDVGLRGPGLEGQSIPVAMLSHASPKAGAGGVEFLPGLEYRSYEGAFQRVADSANAQLVRRGTAEKISNTVATRLENVALDFRGFVEIPQDGEYLFSLKSDDGSVLFVGEATANIEATGSTVVPVPKSVTPRQLLTDRQENFWASVEGVISYIEEQPASARLEITSSSGRMQVEVNEPLDVAPAALINSRVRVAGICQTALSLDGQRVAGSLQTPSFQQVEILQATPRMWSSHPAVPISSLLKAQPRHGDSLTRISAKIHHMGGNSLALAEDESGQINVDISRLGPTPDDVWVGLIGQVVRRGSQDIFAAIVSRTVTADDDLDALRLLTTIDEVKSLSRKEADRGYPVKARGTVTALMDEGFFFQDSTRSIYVEYKNPTRTPTARNAAIVGKSREPLSRCLPRTFARKRPSALALARCPIRCGRVGIS